MFPQQKEAIKSIFGVLWKLYKTLVAVLICKWDLKYECISVSKINSESYFSNRFQNENLPKQAQCIEFEYREANQQRIIENSKYW